MSPGQARPRLGTPVHPHVPSPERWRLAGGLRVVAVPHRELPQVVVRLVLPAGAAADPPGYEGTAGMVGEVLLEGTEHRDALALNATLDLLGASISADASHDHVEVDGVFLSNTLREGLELFAEIVRFPAFPAEEMERIRQESLDSLTARGDEPANVADDHTARLLFGGHPYGRLVSGTREGLEALHADGLRAFHGRWYHPAGASLIVAGDFAVEDVAKLLADVFAGWNEAAAPPHAMPTAGGPRLEPLHHPWPDAPQAEIRIAATGIERASPEWVTGVLANYLLGGSTITGRLGANLREDKGWTYGVRSAFSAGLHPAGWTAETAVDCHVAGAAVREMISEITRMAEDPVPEEELQRAREALILSMPRSFETPGRIVSRFATIESFGLEPDYWSRFPERAERVTAEEIRAFVERHLHPDRLLQVVVGGTGPGPR
jgi:zinc protease